MPHLQSQSLRVLLRRLSPKAYFRFPVLSLIARRGRKRLKLLTRRMVQATSTPLSAMSGRRLLAETTFIATSSSAERAVGQPGGTCGGLAYGAGDTQHGVVLVRVSRVDSKEQSADE